MNKNNLLKSIIWVDDFDNNNMLLENIPKGDEWDADDMQSSALHDADINMTFGVTYSKHVKLFMKISEVLEYFDQYLNFISCIVLDVNLNKAIDNKQKEMVMEMCKKKGIVVKKDLGKYGGYYIFLYLLKSGFPTDHICIYTGNKGRGNATDLWEKIFIDAGILPPISIDRTDNRLLQEWIEGCYRNQYYKTRYLVYKACEFWKTKLCKMKKEDVAFNQIYYFGSEKMQLSIEPETFVNVLERIEMLFPINLPSNCEEIYYQTLQVITIFHEESAKINILDKYSSLRRYHQLVRNFRNWSAHNKFNRNKIDANLFVYIFFITLRTYFQTKENQFAICENGKEIQCYEDYEKEFFDEFLKRDIKYNEFKVKYRSAFERHLDKVQKYDKKSKEKDKRNDRIPVIYECKNVNELLFNSGNIYTLNNGEKMYLVDLLLNVIDNFIVQKNGMDILMVKKVGNI